MLEGARPAEHADIRRGFLGGLGSHTRTWALSCQPRQKWSQTLGDVVLILLDSRYVGACGFDLTVCVCTHIMQDVGVDECELGRVCSFLAWTLGLWGS